MAVDSVDAETTMAIATILIRLTFFLVRVYFFNSLRSYREFFVDETFACSLLAELPVNRRIPGAK